MIIVSWHLIATDLSFYAAFHSIYERALHLSSLGYSQAI